MTQASARQGAERPAAASRPALALLALLAAGCGHDWSAADSATEVRDVETDEATNGVDVEAHEATDGGDVEAREATDGGDIEADEGGESEVTLCGNGVREPGEECDHGSENSDTAPDACRSDCVRAHCGDGVVDSRETCDDGNDIDDDGCRNDCSVPTCGDGRLDSGEVCDDGNRSNTDACLDTCAAAWCGDGFVWEGIEVCDSPDPVPCATDCGSTGAQPCVECRPAGTCVPPEETCNGADDDCDGGFDEDFPCVRGALVSCTTSCGTTGRGTCTDTCDPPGATACTPPTEVCDGVDDDCDGAVDEDYPCVRGALVPCTTSCGTTGTGACTDTCDPPGATACTPPAEVCDGTDQDCDTQIDNGFECSPGTVGRCTVGTCTGMRTCAETCHWGLCNLHSIPPEGDSCDGLVRPILEYAGTRTYHRDTCGAADDFSTAGCGDSGGPDIVYRMSLSVPRIVTLETRGTSFDAVLSVRGPSSVCPGAELICDDNSAGGTPGQARLVLTLSPGTYWVVLDGKTPSDMGDYALTVTMR